MKQKRKENS